MKVEIKEGEQLLAGVKCLEVGCRPVVRIQQIFL